MKNIDFDFVQRVRLDNVLKQQEGPSGKTAPFMRVLEKIRFTDEELSQIVCTQISETEFNYAPPSTEFSKIVAELENVDCKTVANLLETWPNFTTADHRWAQPLLKQLKGK